jgi:hypothetical protein
MWATENVLVAVTVDRFAIDALGSWSNCLMFRYSESTMSLNYLPDATALRHREMESILFKQPSPEVVRLTRY